MRPRSIRLALAIVLLCSQASAQWVRTNGPFGGNVTQLVTNGATLCAISSGELYLSANNGTSWSRSSVAGSTVQAVLLSGPNLFAGTDHGVFLSTNTGTDWTQLNNGLEDTNVCALAVAGAYLVAGTRKGSIFRSEDNGETWNFIDAFDGNQGYQIYALTSSGPILYAGTVVIGPNPPHSFNPFGGLYRSTDYGAHWREANSGLKKGLGTIGVWSILMYGTKVFAGTEEGLFVSLDSGSTWKLTSLGHISVESVAASRSNLFAGASGSGVYLSADSGTSWTQVNAGLTATSARTLAVSPDGAGGTNLFAGNYGGVFLSTDEGTHWIPVNSGLEYSSVTSVIVPSESSTSIFAGTLANGVFVSTNRGSTWTPINTGLTNPGISCMVISGTNLVAGGGSMILRSTNNGLTWTAESWEPASTLSAFALLGTDIFAANLGGVGGGVVRSTDGGMSWNPATEGISNRYARALAVRDTNLFVGTAGGGVFLSTDRGTSWNAVNAGLGNAMVYALAVNGSNLIAGTTAGEVFISTDNGTSWTQGGIVSLESAFTCLFAGGTYLLAGTYYGGVFLSTNNGTTWTSYNTGLSNLVAQSFVVSGADIIAGTNGGVWKRPLSDLTNSVSSPTCQLPADFALAQNYPNPFNPSTTIRYELPKSSMVKLSVYDILGREVSVLVNERKTAGSYEVKFDAAGLASGAYFYRLYAGDFVQAKKLVVLK